MTAISFVALRVTSKSFLRRRCLSSSSSLSSPTPTTTRSFAISVAGGGSAPLTATASTATTTVSGGGRAGTTAATTRATTTGNGDGGGSNSSSGNGGGGGSSGNGGAGAGGGLSTAGIAFFGSLCAGTFGLGTWQLQRLRQKQTMVHQRDRELAMEPIRPGQNDDDLSILEMESESSSSTTSGGGGGGGGSGNNPSYRRVMLRGAYHHGGEILVGPRGPPKGALPNKPGSSAQGMSSSPQGYYVLTPMKLHRRHTNNTTASATTKTTTDGRSAAAVILVNRGWVPRHMVVQDDRYNSSRRQQQQQQRQQQQQSQIPMSTTTPTPLGQWDRPTDEVLITVVAPDSKGEEPKYLVAQHDLRQLPPKLYWYDMKTMEQLAYGFLNMSDDNNNNKNDAGGDDGDESKNTGRLVMVTQVRDNDGDGDDDASPSWPVRPPADQVGEFKVTPAVHAGYAFTWYGLSAAGLYMTRMLVKKRW